MDRPTTPPAWHPDPTNRFEFRYHNGQSWTGDVAIDGHRLLDPLTAESSSPGESPPTNRLAVAAFVLSISAVVIGWVPFVCVLGFVAVVLAIVFGFVGLRRCSDRGNRTGRGLALAAIIVAPVGLAVSTLGVWLSVLTVREFDRFSDVGPVSFETTRCDITDGIAHFEGSVTNESHDVRSYHLTLHFLRPGTRNSLQSAGADISDVPAGESGNWSISQRTTQLELDCKVGTVTGPLPFGDL